MVHRGLVRHDRNGGWVMRGEFAAKYAPALMTAPLGAFDPAYPAIAFGMVTGWLAIVGVMYEQQKPLRDIKRALVVSLLIGGGGALFAAFAVRKLNLDPLGASIAAFAVAFGGVRTIKLFAGTVLNIVNWLIGSLIDDAAKAGRERQKAARLLAEEDRATRERLGLRGDDA